AARLRSGPLPERDAALILRDVARAIQYAHEQGVVHRDLKPANVLLDRDGTPWVADFGLAKSIADDEGLTISGDMLGTPSYMSPEQAIGNVGSIGPAADVWGLGAMLYALLCGQPPFVGSSILDTVRQLLDRDPPPLRVIAPGVSRNLELIVSKCLQKPVDLRYSSAGALAVDLDAFLEGRSISASSAHVSDLVARWLGNTPQSYVLDFWGPLWLAQGLVLFLMMLIAQVLLWAEVASRTPYVFALVLSFIAWSPIFINLARPIHDLVSAERGLATNLGVTRCRRPSGRLRLVP
ncbi:MAG: serine/threonine protein kinase, partial [Planctomycetes bacterium]|nr:serine/threonine protein kinase [Planctomycetota bacterium]